MKQPNILDCIKIMWRADKTRVQATMLMLIITATFIIIISYASETKIPLLALLVPVGMAIKEILFYKTIVNESYQNIILENRYAFMYNRFMEGE